MMPGAEGEVNMLMENAIAEALYEWRKGTVRRTNLRGRDLDREGLVVPNSRRRGSKEKKYKVLMINLSTKDRNQL